MRECSNGRPTEATIQGVVGSTRHDIKHAPKQQVNALTSNPPTGQAMSYRLNSHLPQQLYADKQLRQRSQASSQVFDRVNTSN